MSSLASDQRKVISGIVVGIILVTSLFATGYYVIPDNPKGLESPMQRLVFTLRWQCVSILTVLFGIIMVGNKRFLSPAIDPISGKSEHILAVDHRYLQNTFEQFILNAFGQAALSTYLTPSSASRVIPTLVFLFTIGRILFWIGYRISPVRRATGFVITFFPTIVTWLCNIRFLIVYGAQF